MEEETSPRLLVLPMIISAFLIIVVIGAFLSAKNRTGTIVLPGGSTYLGPTPTPAAAVPKNNTGIIPIPEGTAWTTRKGAAFPFSFSYPESLSLGVFPNDPYDAITIFYPGTDANTNIFIRVDNLTTLGKQNYKGDTEKYANDWWKDYSWQKSASVTRFTNKSGLTGYRAKYINDQNTTPYDHVFFEVPNDPNLVIWMSGRLFEPAVFDRMVDSVTWSKIP